MNDYQKMFFKHPVIEKLDFNFAKKLFEKCSFVEYNENDIIQQMGTTDIKLKFILKGQVKIAKVPIGMPIENAKIIARLNNGHVLGEQSFVDGLPHSASIFADSFVILAVLKEEDFKDLKTNFIYGSFDLLLQLAKNISIKMRNHVS